MRIKNLSFDRYSFLFILTIKPKWKMYNERNYFYFKDGNQIGPVNFNELIQNINSDTLVWYDGLSNWEEAKNIDELKNIFRETIREIVIEKPVEVIKEVIVEKPVEVIKEVVIEKSLEKTKEIDTFKKNNVNHNTNKSTSQETKKVSNSSSKKLVYAVLTIIGIILSVYFIFFQNKNIQPPVEVKIYANIKKNNKVRIGYVNVDKLDSKIQNCIINVFGDRLFKLSEVNSINQLVNECRNEQIDIVIVDEVEKKELEQVFDFSKNFKVQGKSGKFYLAFPLGNESHLKKFNNCL